MANPQVFYSLQVKLICVAHFSNKVVQSSYLKKTPIIQPRLIFSKVFEEYANEWRLAHVVLIQLMGDCWSGRFWEKIAATQCISVCLSSAPHGFGLFEWDNDSAMCQKWFWSGLRCWLVIQNSLKSIQRASIGYPRQTCDAIAPPKTLHHFKEIHASMGQGDLIFFSNQDFYTVVSKH